MLGLGVCESDILLTWPNKNHQIEDVAIKTTFAIPFGGDDLTHVGYFLRLNGGPTIYFTGDTDYHDLLAYVADEHPDVMVTVVNGAYHNLSPHEAAKLTHKIKPQVVFPCHYDLFPDNSLDPRLFRTNLHTYGMAEKYRELAHGQPYTFPETILSTRAT